MAEEARATPVRDMPTPEDRESRSAPRIGATAWRRFQARVLIAGGDLAALLLAIGLITLTRLAIGQHDDVGRVLGALMPLFLAVAVYHHAYDRDAIRQWKRGYRRAVSALIVALLALAGIAFALKTGTAYSRVLVLSAVGLGAVLMAPARWTTVRLARYLLPGAIVETAIIHDGSIDRDLIAVEGATRIDVGRLGLVPRLDDPAMLDRIGRVLRGCERVVVSCAPPMRDPWAAVLKGLGIEVEMVIAEVDTLGLLGTGMLDGRLTAIVARGALRPFDLVLKRCFDLAVVLFLLPGLLIVTAIVAIAIKLDDGGPVFFRQMRMGHGNRLFGILKFRTMRHADADHHGATSATRGDLRVTRVGRFLRRTSIDEMPQLFNVLTGTMSVVGPRPHALGSLAGDALFWDADHRYWQRHVVKPGLTGLAQVRGFRGSTAATSDLTDRVQADLEYIHDWTIWRDLRIALQTGGVLLHPNAF